VSQTIMDRTGPDLDPDLVLRNHSIQESEGPGNQDDLPHFLTSDKRDVLQIV
jgi:hypothetical protein